MQSASQFVKKNLPNVQDEGGGGLNNVQKIELVKTDIPHHNEVDFRRQSIRLGSAQKTFT